MHPMNVEETPFVPVEPAEISAALNRVFAEMRRSGRTYTRSANRTMLVLSSGRQSGSGLDGLLRTFAQVHPSRFFVLIQGSAEQRLKTEIATIGISLSKAEVSCSEVIRISSAPKDSKVVAEIVRSQLLSGMPIELAVFDSEVPAEVIQRFAAVADLALYDSAFLEDKPQVLSGLVELAQPSIDTQWLTLAPWRDEVRRVFDRPSLAQVLPHLTVISIESFSPDPGVVPTCSALLAGWIGSRLGLTSVRRTAQERAMLGSDGRSVSVRFSRTGAALDAIVNRVAMHFGDLGEVCFVRDGGEILTKVGIAPEYLSQRPIEDEEREAVLRRYFLIGESTANYPSAMRLGLTLR
ncbi:MAG: hypothetical protein EBZ48_10815 [Proteobacteria bacterium]|nr:hypothetical protein [Pseudomonadota bacterium]